VLGAGTFGASGACKLEAVRMCCDQDKHGGKVQVRLAVVFWPGLCVA
jgi:hypothetical protein